MSRKLSILCNLAVITAALSAISAVLSTSYFNTAISAPGSTSDESPPFNVPLIFPGQTAATVARGDTLTALFPVEYDSLGALTERCLVALTRKLPAALDLLDLRSSTIPMLENWRINPDGSVRLSVRRIVYVDVEGRATKGQDTIPVFKREERTTYIHIIGAPLLTTYAASGYHNQEDVSSINYRMSHVECNSCHVKILWEKTAAADQCICCHKVEMEAKMSAVMKSGPPVSEYDVESCNACHARWR